MEINVSRLPIPAILFALAAVVALGVGLGQSGASAAQADDGFEPLLAQRKDGTYHKGGWNHYGPGYFTLDHETGVLEGHGGMGLFWYSVREYTDFELQLEFKSATPEANSGVFVRVPGVPVSDDYIYHSFEVQIHDASVDGIHRTGAIYDAEPAVGMAAKSGEWNHYRIRFVGNQITVWLNGEQVVDWTAEPRGKIEDFAPGGYIGLQNHDWDTSVAFRNIRIKDLAADAS